MRNWAWLAATLSLSATPALAADLTLTGVMSGADHQTYRELAFRVPAGVTAVTIEFDYRGKEQKSVIDVGLRDPQRFRGWSGGNKQRFTVSEAWATPSYLPGPLPAGTWRLILGVPNLRKDARAEYIARITFGRGVFHGFADAPLKIGPAWYRGDLHLHTAHSDGSCASQSGKRVPCPLYRTVEAAAARGLDFIAVTDHNTISQAQGLAELQPAFDQLLLIPGREITTFQGHANVFGVTSPLDFQLGSSRAPTFGRILDQAERAGGLVSINHPSLPSGEICMGCGWTAPTDDVRVQAVEVVNGDRADGPLSGLAFWEARLNAGRRVTAIGGSDNHDATLPPAGGIGVPTTVVWAANLSQDAILASLRAGHAFVDVQGTRDRILELTATSATAEAHMGDVLLARPGELISFSVRAEGSPAGVRFTGPDGKRQVMAVDALVGGGRSVGGRFVFSGQPGWIRADLISPDNRLLVVGNPIYLRPAAP